jgi:hypothetical protein
VSDNKQKTYTVAISISDSPDMPQRGLGTEHLEDAMSEIARHLLAKGFRLIYGGDLREEGFTEILFELVTRHHQDNGGDGSQSVVCNYLAWPVHINMPVKAFKKRCKALDGVAKLICLTDDGKVIGHDERLQHVARPATDQEWGVGLTAMRQVMADACDARIVLGGKVEGFQGSMPGIAEEAQITLKRKQPLFVMGGFGGCAYDIALELGLLKAIGKAERVWLGREQFGAFDVNSLNNGLCDDENITLAKTVYVDQAVALILRGLLRLGKVAGK